MERKHYIPLYRLLLITKPSFNFWLGQVLHFVQTLNLVSFKFFLKICFVLSFYAYIDCFEMYLLFQIYSFCLLRLFGLLTHTNTEITCIGYLHDLSSI